MQGRSGASARAASTGTGAQTPPSTSQSSPSRTGLNTPGIAIEARIACSSGPSCMRRSSPVWSTVAIAI